MGERLKDRAIIVTGAGRGIGQAFAVGLAREGAAIVAADLGECDETLAQIASDGGRAISVPCDVGDEGQVANLAERAMGEYGRIDGLFNVAGIYPLGGVEQTSLELWERIMRVNVTGTFLCSRAVLPHMRAAGRGKIINISSGTFYMGAPGLAAYVASKGAVIGFTRSASREYGEAGIQVNAIAPGLTRTPGVMEGDLDDWLENVLQAQAIKRTEVAEDMVGTAVFLASSDSDFMTGQVLAVDGGLVHV